MKVVLPEIVKPGHRLGRHINHDPRSLSYTVAKAVADKSVVWSRHNQVFDQGDLGSCTGNAEVGLLSCDPFFNTLTPDQQLSLTEELAVKLYALATQLDNYNGIYPPQDTGSDGLSVNKAAKNNGLTAGYVWATNVDQAKTLIQQGPFIIGTQWTSTMDKPNGEGIILNPASGVVRGGHEYMCRQRDAERDLWWFDNSWGPTFGKAGRFAYNTAGLQALMARGGDITQSVAINAAPPQPNPTPGPNPPEPTPIDPDIQEWWPKIQAWLKAFHSPYSPALTAARACTVLAQKKGLM